MRRGSPLLYLLPVSYDFFRDSSTTSNRRMAPPVIQAQGCSYHSFLLISMSMSRPFSCAISARFQTIATSSKPVFCVMLFMPLYRFFPSQQGYYKEDQEYNKQNFCDARCTCSNTGKPKYTGYDGNDEEDNRIPKHSCVV